MTYDRDEPMWVTPDLAAGVAKVDINTIRKWRARGIVRADQKGRYSLRDVWNWLEQRDTNRIRQHADIG